MITVTNDSKLHVVAMRFEPNVDVRQQLESLAKEKKISAGVVLCAVGSLSQARLRFAGKDEHTVLMGKHEILTLSGMISEAGAHLHMSISNEAGRCMGGHVVKGCIVYTTLEIVIGLMPDVSFRRELDIATGFPELLIASIDEDGQT